MHSSRVALPINYVVTVVTLASLSCSLSQNALTQQAKPNLTGSWKLNLSNGKVAPHHMPDLYRIKHSDSRLEMVQTVEGRSESFFYVVDGKDRVTNMSGQVRAKAYWDGDTVVIEKHLVIDAGVRIWTSRYRLSEDGKSLVVAIHTKDSSFNDIFDESLTYEKQQ